MNQLPAYSHFQQTLVPNTTHNSSMVFVNMTYAVHWTPVDPLKKNWYQLVRKETDQETEHVSE